ncbi:MAG TPA: sigma 54-interacting transcriptional regulator [Polyangiales bacterium]|nr:sigma 54-interacting transcriptional regulator [Polyangiales bacterium]
MPSNDETRDDSDRTGSITRRARPGIVVVMNAGEPSGAAFEVGSVGVEVGRGSPQGLLENDDRISRRHVRIRHTKSAWEIQDLESRNGTFVNGEELTGERTCGGEPLIRIGRSLLWAVPDVAPFKEVAARKLPLTGPVLGGRLTRAWTEIALASRSGSTLCVRGESGAGKELAARAFHEARFGVGTKAPFVAVNCAAIPEGLAERLLFGAQRGAYSGANVDAEGYMQAAHKGSLFLDEIAELDPQVQAKLLRVLETREVMPLGATKPKQIEIALCVASHRNLRDEVARGRFREDLYFRLGRPQVDLPPLRERLDELPWLIANELQAVDAGLSAAVTFLEEVALRTWPGNVRELLHEARRAAHRALAEQVSLVDTHHLSAEAGRQITSTAPISETPSGRPKARVPTDEEIEKALAEQSGNVRGTARALGMHRNQLRRWLEKRGDVLPPDDGD